MIRILLAALLCCVLLTASIEASSRNCTAAEKKKANLQLSLIATDTALHAKLSARHAPFGIPVSTGPGSGEQTLFQNGYILRHDSDLRTTLWVAYQLTDADVANAVGKDRVNCFRKDPRLSRDEAASTSDYNEPVFDQGHMTNDADLKDDLTEQINTYVMSNMSPQHCRFNRGIWLSLEHLARIWAEHYRTLYVTSAAIFDRDGVVGRDDDAQAMRMTSRNGKRRVAIPSHYYKSFLRQEGDKWHTITFLLPHNNEDHGVEWADVLPSIEAAIVSLDAVEATANVRLYPELDRTALIESANGDGWDLSAGRPNFSASCQ